MDNIRDNNMDWEDLSFPDNDLCDQQNHTLGDSPIPPTPSAPAKGRNPHPVIPSLDNPHHRPIPFSNVTARKCLFMDAHPWRLEPVPARAFVAPRAPRAHRRRRRSDGSRRTRSSSAVERPGTPTSAAGHKGRGRRGAVLRRISFSSDMDVEPADHVHRREL